MKNSSKLLLSAALAAGLVAVTTSCSTSQVSGEPLHSPRGLANQVKHVPGVSSDVNLVSGWYPGAAVKQGAMFHSAVESHGIKDVNLTANATRPTLSPKDPRFETAWRENAVKEFQVAPVK